MTTSGDWPVSGALCPRCRGVLTELADRSGSRCGSCSGVFIVRELVERFLESVPTNSDGDGYRSASLPPDERPDPVPRRVWEKSVRYLMCPVCKQPMNRSNFARASGVLVDVCPRHGTWFDDGEAAAAAAWVSRLPQLKEDEREQLRHRSAAPNRPLIRAQLLSLLKG